MRDPNLYLLAENILRRMHRHGWSEMELAQASGLAPRTIGNFLRPDNRGPKRNASGTITNLFKIAIALNVEPEYLLRPPEVGDFHDAVETAYVERRDVEPIEGENQ